MAIERTLSIIKPDAVAKNVIGKIYSRFESNGLKIVASKMAWLFTARSGGKFYGGAQGAFFLQGTGLLHDFGPGDDPGAGRRETPFAKNRELMGATDPKKPLRERSAPILLTSIDANAVHGSDGPETAARWKLPSFSPK
jgi:nucleoside-diphosphate kinase